MPANYLCNMVAKRIVVIGSSCSGKTSLGKQLHVDMQIPHLDLDEIVWLPNWLKRPNEEAEQLLADFVNMHDSWVITGNYTGMSSSISWPKATHVVWLHYPLHTIMYRYFTRTYKRIITKEPVCNGNYESVYNTFFAEEPLLPWILKHYKRQNDRFRQLQNGHLKDKHWTVIKHNDQLGPLVAKLSKN